MAEIKKRFTGLSDWLSFELETDAIEPPILRVRVKPIQKIGAVDLYAGGDKSPKLSEFIFYSVIDAVEEWDLTENGVAIPVTRETKVLHLGPRLSDKIAGQQTLLGIEIFTYATNQENFLKN